MEDVDIAADEPIDAELGHLLHQLVFGLLHERDHRRVHVGYTETIVSKHNISRQSIESCKPCFASSTVETVDPHFRAL
jgi:hypothetical protein